MGRKACAQLLCTDTQEQAHQVATFVGRLQSCALGALHQKLAGSRGQFNIVRAQGLAQPRPGAFAKSGQYRPGAAAAGVVASAQIHESALEQSSGTCAVIVADQYRHGFRIGREPGVAQPASSTVAHEQFQGGAGVHEVEHSAGSPSALRPTPVAGVAFQQDSRALAGGAFGRGLKTQENTAACLPTRIGQLGDRGKGTAAVQVDAPFKGHLLALNRHHAHPGVGTFW